MTFDGEYLPRVIKIIRRNKSITKWRVIFEEENFEEKVKKKRHNSSK
jgi:hypothetical protein